MATNDIGPELVMQIRLDALEKRLCSVASSLQALTKALATPGCPECGGTGDVNPDRTAIEPCPKCFGRK
jgi:hypothetical protein